MCGIAGILSKTGNKRDQVEKMLKSLIHRGPDEKSYWEGKNYYAGMRRLSINDIEGGSQPFYDESRNIVLFYNGEIYNYQSLKKQLIDVGIKFKTSCDGEVICHLYKIYGNGFLSKLEGMFSIALWDQSRETLILGRDFPGEKPLYYSKLDCGGIAFSSEINSLIKCKDINKKLDEQALWDFPTFLWVPEPNTIYENIKALKPGNFIKYSLNDGMNVFSFKEDIKFPELKESYSEKYTLELIRDTVHSSIKNQLLSDVPIGTFLSGGIDSSIITAVASKYINNLNTFCIGFKDSYDPYHGESNESDQAKEFAEFLGTNHTNINVTADTFRELLPLFLKSAGQPFAVSSGLGILTVSQKAKEMGIKVLLSGDGADEAFGGYSWYSSLSKIKPNIDKSFEPYRYIDLGDSITEKEKRLSGYKNDMRAWALHYYGSEKEKMNLFSNDFIKQTSLSHFRSYDFCNPIDYINHDREFYFPNEMLTKVDRLTMAFSIEGRSPFAAPRVQLLAKQLNWDYLCKNNILKWSLKEAFKDVLPNKVIKRKKHGFNVPIDFWLKNQWNDLFEETFSNESELYKYGLIDKNAKKNALCLLTDPKKVSGHFLFCFIILNEWLKTK